MKWIICVAYSDSFSVSDVNKAVENLPGDPITFNRLLESSQSYPDSWADSPVAPFQAIVEYTEARTAVPTTSEYSELTKTLRAKGIDTTGAYVVDEVVQINRADRPWANGATPPDAKAIYLVRRKYGLASADFLDHWRHVHPVLAREHHRGMTRYVQHYVVQRFGSADPTIDGIVTINCPSFVTLTQDMIPDAAAQNAISADIAKFVGSSEAYEVEETILRSPPAEHRSRL